MYLACNGLFFVVKTDGNKDKEEDDDVDTDSVVCSTDAPSTFVFGNGVDKHGDKDEEEKGPICWKGSDIKSVTDDTTKEQHSEQDDDNVCRSMTEIQKSVWLMDLKSGSYDSVMHSWSNDSEEIIWEEEEHVCLISLSFCM